MLKLRAAFPYREETARIGVAALVALAGCGGAEVLSTRVVASIEISPDTATVVAGESTQLSARVVDDAGQPVSGASLTWASSDTSVATVTADGLVEARSPGVVVISARSGTVSATMSLTVLPRPVASIVLSPVDPELFLGEGTTLRAVALDAVGDSVLDHPTPAWASDDPSVVAVTAEGEVRGLAVGSTRVEVRIGAVTASTVVSVTRGPVDSVAVFPKAAIMLVGQERPFQATPLGAEGRERLGYTVAWSSSDPSTVSITSDGGLATALALGSAVVTATVGDESTSLAVTVEGGTPITGRVIDVLGDAIEELQFIIRSELFADSAAIEPDGDFSILAPDDFGPDSVDFIVDRSGDGARRYFPSLIRMGGTPAPQTTWLSPPHPPDTVIRRMVLALVPTEWTIPDGIYSGTTVPVSLAAAYERTGYGGSGLYPQGPEGWDIAPAWQQEDLPIPVVLNRDSSTVAISASDSVALWGILDRMETIWGEDLFVATEYTPWSPGEPRPMRLDVNFDHTRSPVANYWWFRADVPARDGQPGFYSALGIYAASVTLTDADMLRTNPSVVLHEFEHTLGVHHSCSFESLMGGGLCPRPEEPTRYDVAYDQVKRAVATVRLRDLPLRFSGAEQVHFGREQARIGERVRMLGLPPYDSTDEPGSAWATPLSQLLELPHAVGRMSGVPEYGGTIVRGVSRGR